MSQPPGRTLELTEAHVTRLRAIAAEGFELVSFPFFPGHVGVVKSNFAALLEPEAGGRLRIVAQPGYLIENNISALVEEGGERWFVWKTQRVRATAALLGAFKSFREELERRLELPAKI